MNEQQFKQLKIVLCEHDKVWAYCVYHKDTLRPNLSISLLDRYYGRYKCWACSAEGYLSKEQMSKLNLSGCIIYKNSINNLHTLWKDYNKICYNNLQKFPLLKLGLAKELNVSIQSLDRWLVGYDNYSFTIPMFREDLEEYYREIGFCGTQRRFSDGSKRCVTGSRLGWMYPYNYLNSEGYLFICEGFSDGISVYDLGLNVISRPHCRHIDGILEYFEYVLEGIDTVIIIPDNDTVGIDGAEHLADELDNKSPHYDEDGFEMDCDNIIFSFDGAKDVRELIQQKGKDYVKQELSEYI